MRMNIDAPKYIRYQTWGLTLTVTVMALVTIAFTLGSAYYDNLKRLSEIESDIEQQQRTALKSEMDSAVSEIRFIYGQAERLLMDGARDQVNQAWQIADTIYQQEHLLKGESKRSVAGLIKEALRDIRFFDGRGYYFIGDTQGEMILLPPSPDMEGRSFWDSVDDRGTYTARDTINVALENAAGGYARYRWYVPGYPDEMKEKVVYARLFEPLGWVIGTGDYVFHFEDQLKERALERLANRRFGDGGCFAVLTAEGRLLLSPGLPELEGKHFSEMDPAYGEAVQNILAQTSAEGNFARYKWFKPGSTLKEAKLSLVRSVPELDWVLIVGTYRSSWNESIAAQRQIYREDLHKQVLAAIPLLGLVAFVGFVLAYVLSRWLSGLFGAYQGNIKSQQEALQENATQLGIAAKVFEASNEGMLVADGFDRVLKVNSAFTFLTGYDLADLEGGTAATLFEGVDGPGFDELRAKLETEGFWEGEVQNRHKDGYRFPAWMSMTLAQNVENDSVNLVMTLEDISERKQQEAQLRQLKEYDSLTNLPNRQLLSDRAEQQLAACKRKGEQLAVMFIDLDRFKNVNDSLGHDAGDALLKVAARRIAYSVRPTDTVSRIGGDEFVILLSDYGTAESLAEMAGRLQRVLSKRTDIEGCELAVTASIGIAVYPYDGLDFPQLCRNADTALYHAKANGRDGYQFYTEDMNRQVHERLTLENALREALPRGELELYY
ncbi:MAG: diguanylate cyclase, partial [Oceanospirillales bacterium]|nr:diguanylate cyclase [Oceanospirillales bacterium]